MVDNAHPESPGLPKSQEWKSFLETSAPESVVRVTAELKRYPTSAYLSWVSIQIHCPSKDCGGVRWFDSEGALELTPNAYAYAVSNYSCRHCQAAKKFFAVKIRLDKDSGEILAYKLGEYPPFGPPTPARVISLVGPDQELFFKGRRAENQGLGIGAFAYYRRVVENQWSRIVLEVRKVAERLGADPEMLTSLEQVAQHTQFGRAVDDFKPALPAVLLIAGGQNPLTLLHSALSEAIHTHSDAECLDLAQDVRVVLSELADRIGQAVKDDAELQQAVNRLRNRRIILKSTTGTGKDVG